jgi:hypothetical protein
MKRTFLYLLLPLLLLSACASGPNVVSNVRPGIDFRTFQTFNFIEPLGTDRANGARTPMSSMLMNSMTREMEARGLRLSDDPDLLIDFNVWTEERVDIRSTPAHTVHRSHWHRGINTWPTYSTTVRQYTEGALAIDLIDPRSNMLVSELVATQRLRENTFSQQQSDEVVALLLSRVWAN